MSDWTTRGARLLLGIGGVLACGCTQLVDVDGYEFTAGEGGGSGGAGGGGGSGGAGGTGGGGQVSPAQSLAAGRARPNATCGAGAAAFCICYYRLGADALGGPCTEDAAYQTCASGQPSGDTPRCYEGYASATDVDCDAANDACLGQDDESPQVETSDDEGGDAVCDTAARAFCACAEQLGVSCDLETPLTACTSRQDEDVLCYGTHVDSDGNIDCTAAGLDCLL